jgi:hypothetical protein
MIAVCNRGIDEGRSGAPKARIREETPQGRVRVRDRGDHQKSERGKFANISARF